ncbi:MAG: tRNA pseudouridine32 synthase/23S rRNA pseudouridine746 synthase [Myxococcota bacterium]|jgi:tRNA pseudouridine32 synthase/23S rRNA pseudouridine746 synthase
MTIKEVDDFVYAPPTQPWLSILYEDDDIVVLDKPSGLLSVPGRRLEHRDSAFSRVAEAHPTARIVHRLDMDTSGILVVGLHIDAERELHRQFRERTVQKSYRARVFGHPEDDEGLIDLPLSRLKVRPPRSVVDHEHGKPSRTRYRVTARDPDGTARLDLFPETGRSHQLRVHLLMLGHPILGDRFYAEGAALAAAERLCLHAAELTVAHPTTGEPISFTAPAPF